MKFGDFRLTFREELRLLLERSSRPDAFTKDLRGWGMSLSRYRGFRGTAPSKIVGSSKAFHRCQTTRRLRFEFYPKNGVLAFRLKLTYLNAVSHFDHATLISGSGQTQKPCLMSGKDSRF